MLGTQRPFTSKLVKNFAESRVLEPDMTGLRRFVPLRFEVIAGGNRN
jgi:hypothetical protein